jgi:starvation-inducible DNA-binding protein
MPAKLDKSELSARRAEPLTLSSDIAPKSVTDISGALNALLADVFAVYLKTKNFHWHMSGPHFRDYHLLLDDHADAVFVTPQDMLAELHEDEKHLTLSMRAAHDLTDDAGDVATTSLLENWIDQSQRRSWFLFETTRTSKP